MQYLFVKIKSIDVSGAKEQYELLNLMRIETAKNRKLLTKLDRDSVQLNASFTVISRETIILTYDKNFILTML